MGGQPPRFTADNSVPGLGIKCWGEGFEVEGKGSGLGDQTLDFHGAPLPRARNDLLRAVGI